MGLANAATIRVGQSAGRQDNSAVKQVIISANGLSAIFAVVSIAIYVTLGPQMIGVFLDPGEPSRIEVIEIGTVLLMVAALFQLADAGQVQALSHLRGLQDTRVPMLMAAFSYWVVGMPVSYALGFVFGGGGVGIWIGLTIGLLCAWALMGGRLFRMVFSQAASAKV
jgi:MATE family multidrug resistance protein